MSARDNEASFPTHFFLVEISNSCLGRCKLKFLFLFPLEFWCFWLASVLYKFSDAYYGKPHTASLLLVGTLRLISKGLCSLHCLNPSIRLVWTKPVDPKVIWGNTLGEIFMRSATKIKKQDQYAPCTPPPAPYPNLPPEKHPTDQPHKKNWKDI